ncbi:SagB/ThcOx family dehydrogenase [Arthrobacter antibioticus]|uniref:SagB/ThcOx family dehydrogenase n=1 Tax=Arthrobacter sp. H35-MC1 TaxID=3046203 RepID=UPI0024B9F395|nr:SagB/ThcOx family dehydrogenase [Arthrobacter sp. H35-MC1]MDJ0318632.1 SagB/ThcOx family dehydrogenase [Arthrobacter sp. H35-MC1]
MTDIKRTDIDRHATNLADVVYGNESLRFDDAGENWFEATKIYRDSMSWDAPGVGALLRSQALQKMSQRAGKRYTNRPVVRLPKAAETKASFTDLLANRWSDDEFAPGPVSLDVVTAVLEAGYGVISRRDGLRRPVPSGGALYPLDLYLLPRNVEGLEDVIYHYDPFRRLLVALGDFDDSEFLNSTLRADALENMAFSVVVSATFWRSRFKYGPRAYRFAFLEAGHIMQNMLLMANAHGIGARPYGGFIDDELTDILIDQNGVDEAPIYMLTAGRRVE